MKLLHDFNYKELLHNILDIMFNFIMLAICSIAYFFLVSVIIFIALVLRGSFL
jgi:hypothetical protein